MFFAVECIPKLAGNPKFLAATNSSLDDLFNSLPHLWLIAVIRRAIEMAITELGGLDRQFGCRCVGDLPKSQSDGRDAELIYHGFL